MLNISGLMIAKGLASNGATVYVGGRRLELLEEATNLRFGKENEKRIIAYGSLHIISDKRGLHVV